ncbi:hypothetical protein GWL_03520 [Herbaspirillum sp. GW103]|nr:hypothetical protein GWL_03520 [Herbaspirillum sp. GW103]
MTGEPLDGHAELLSDAYFVKALFYGPAPPNPNKSPRKRPAAHKSRQAIGQGTTPALTRAGSPIAP